MKLSIITIPMFSSLLLFGSNPINTPMSLPGTAKVTVVQSHTDKELLWVDEQIKAILPARIGISDNYINSLIDPIKYKIPERTVSTGSTLLAPPRLGSVMQNIPLIIPKVIEEPLKLQGLMNKSALINGKWYRVNDSVRNYSIGEIKATSVVLNGKKGEPLVLFLSKNNNNIKIQTK